MDEQRNHASNAEPRPTRLVPPLTTTGRAAKDLGVCRDTILRMIKRGEVPVVYVGRSVRIPVQWVDDRLRAVVVAL